MVRREVWLSSLNRGPGSAGKWREAQEIAAKLRRVDVLAAKGESVAEDIRAIGVRDELYRAFRDFTRRQI